jgi:hypothetical protein
MLLRRLKENNRKDFLEEKAWDKNYKEDFSKKAFKRNSVSNNNRWFIAVIFIAIPIFV